MANTINAEAPHEACLGGDAAAVSRLLPAGGTEGVAAEAAAVRAEVAATAAAGPMSKARYVSVGCSL